MIKYDKLWRLMEEKGKSRSFSVTYCFSKQSLLVSKKICALAVKVFHYYI